VHSSTVIARQQYAVAGNFHAPAGACASELRPWAEFR